MKTYVAIYEHRHGRSVRAFTSVSGAEAWRQDLAQEWWSGEIGSEDRKPEGPEAAADRYFELVEDEFFGVEECEIEGFAGLPEYLDRFPAEVRHYADQAYQDGYVDGAQSEMEAPAGE